MSSTAYAWAPITKSEEQPDGTLLVYGPATNTALDRDQQRMDPSWLNTAMPKWFAEGGNIREQHDAKRAVGVAVGLHKAEGSEDWMLAARVVDPVAVAKVKHRVLKGYSIGIRNPHVTMGKADAPNGLIDGGDIIETSLADRPSNPTTIFTMAKADSSGELADVEDPEVEELGDDEDEETAPDDEAAETKADVASQVVAALTPLLTKVSDAIAALKPEPATAPAEESEVDEPETETPDETKTDAPDLTKADTAEIVKAAVAEATKTLRDELTLVKAELAKVAAMPVAGGPVAMRTASQTAAARGSDAANLRAQAADYIAKADATQDSTLRAGYRKIADELLAKASA